jgi:hypothetical protein
MNFDEFIRLVDEWLEKMLLPPDALMTAQSRLKQVDAIVKKARKQAKAQEGEVLLAVSEYRKRSWQRQLAEKAKREDLKLAATELRDAAYKKGKLSWDMLAKTNSTLADAIKAREKLAVEVQVILNASKAQRADSGGVGVGSSRPESPKATQAGTSSQANPGKKIDPLELDRQIRQLEIEEELRQMTNGS